MRYYKIVGAGNGSMWGTDVYTADSTLAAAAVHSGAVRLAESGVVKVTVLPGQAAYTGSTRNGLTSNSFGQYSSSYRIKRVTDAESNELDAESSPRRP